LEERTKAEKSAEKAKIAQKQAKASAEEALRQQKIAEEQRKLAVENEGKAKLSAAEAKKQQGIAEQRKLEADKNAAEANRQKDIAQRERYLSVAKAIALKSKELNDNELGALLAQQAYNFNTSHKGYAYDNDIYNGLFQALKKYDHPLTRSLEGHNKGAARALVTRQSNSNIFSGGSDGKVIRWSQVNGTWTGEVLKDFSTPTGGVTYGIYSLDISPDGNYLAAGGLYNADRDANYALVFNLSNPGSEPKKIYGYKSDIENINFTTDGKGFFARCNSGKSIMYCDLNTAKEVIHTEEKITSIDLSPDGTKLLGGGVNGNLYVWSVKNNFAPQKYSILKDQDILAVSFMPDGRRVVMGDENGVVRIIEFGLPAKVLSGHTSQIEQIKFSFSGQFMATASKDGSVRLWNLRQLNEQPQVLSDHDWVWGVAFTPDDEQLMAGIHAREETLKGVNQTIHAWPTKLTTMSTQICGLVKRNMDKEEWDLYTNGLDYEKTCSNLPGIK
jgi:WD40 repeat protein